MLVLGQEPEPQKLTLLEQSVRGMIKKRNPKMKNYKTNGGYITFETADTAPKAISGKNKPNRGDDGNYKNSPEAQDKQNRIRNARKQGKTYREIAKIEDVSFQYAQMVCTRVNCLSILSTLRSFKLRVELTQQLELAQKKLISAKEKGMTRINPRHTSQGEIIEDLIEEYLPVYLEKNLSKWKNVMGEVEQTKKQLQKLQKEIGSGNLEKLMSQIGAKY